jgi:MATE family multidrug resistance protein
LLLAFPLILANITTPLLGFVDTAILGRMGEVSILAGAAVGSLIITQIYWVCGFLKMSITGVSAQSLNSESTDRLKVLAQGCFLALLLAIVLLLGQKGFVELGLYFAKADKSLTLNIEAYFYTRIWGAPAALINMVVIGWLIGLQKTKSVLVLQVIINLVNIIASVTLVFGFGLGVTGVAAATVFAEYFMLFCGGFLAWRYFSGQSRSDSGQSRFEFGQSKSKLQIEYEWFTWSSLSNLVSLNSHIFIRNLALQFTLAFITLKGAQYGAQAAAVNAIIMQFFALIALGLDGIANAVEALVGEAKGLKNKNKLNQQVKIGLLWSSAFACVYALLFFFLDSLVINLLTHHQSVIAEMQDYRAIIIILPIIAHWCFLYDGVFVGLSMGKPMRTSMVLSVVVGFLPTYWVMADTGNMALWKAMLVFLFCRALFLGAYYEYLLKKEPNKLLLGK